MRHTKPALFGTSSRNLPYPAILFTEAMVQILHPNEFQTDELSLEYLDYAPHRFLREPTYHFLMRLPQVETPVGRINLRASNSELIVNYAGHIGYEVYEAYRGHGLAARSVDMLKPLARRLALRPLWITCAPENIASRRTAERSGGVLIDVVDIPESHFLYAVGARQKARFRVEL